MKNREKEKEKKEKRQTTTKPKQANKTINQASWQINKKKDYTEQNMSNDDDKQRMRGFYEKQISKGCGNLNLSSSTTSSIRKL